MVRAIVLAITATGRSLDLLPEIRAIEGVEEAHVVAGDYDVVIELEGETTADILRESIERIRNLDGVGNLKTYVAID